MSHLSLEQCKRLNELGFPQDSNFIVCKYDNETEWRHEYLGDEVGYPGDDYFACPTLEELIEWLGVEMNSLHTTWDYVGHKYVAYSQGMDIYGHGKTPLEAVYNLVVAIK